MRASPLTRARHALAAGALFLAAGGLWACDGSAVVDPEGPGIVLTANDSIPNDSIPGDTIPPDTVPGDTTNVPPDTIPGDTTNVPPDTIPGDTTANPGGGQQTGQLVVSVGAQSRDTAAVQGVGPAVYSVRRGNSSNVVLVDSTTAWGFDSEQLPPGRYTVTLLAYPSIYRLAPGETGERSVVLTPNNQTSIGFLLERKP